MRYRISSDEIENEKNYFITNSKNIKNNKRKKINKNLCVILLIQRKYQLLAANRFLKSLTTSNNTNDKPFKKDNIFIRQKENK